MANSGIEASGMEAKTNIGTRVLSIHDLLVYDEQRGLFAIELSLCCSIPEMEYCIAVA